MAHRRKRGQLTPFLMAVDFFRGSQIKTHLAQRGTLSGKGRWQVVAVCCQTLFTIHTFSGFLSAQAN